MIRLTVSEVHNVVESTLRAQGIPDADSKWIASLMISSHLRGYDSHGLGFLPLYIQQLSKGQINPNPKIRVASEADSMAVIDGDMGMGHIVARHAVEIAMKKAGNTGVASVALRKTPHMGRIGAVTEHAAKNGFVALMWVNITLPLLAPFGGTLGRLGTNPFAVSFPRMNNAIMTFDISCGISSFGKVRNKLLAGEQTPPGWLIDHNGHPTTDPKVLFTDPKGSLVPFGGHRGFGFALVAEILAGIISDSGANGLYQGPPLNGALMILLQVEKFLPKNVFEQNLEKFLKYIKDTPTAEGFKEIHIPSENATSTESDRLQHGIEIEEALWSQILAFPKVV